MFPLVPYEVSSDSSDVESEESQEEILPNKEISVCTEISSKVSKESVIPSFTDVFTNNDVPEFLKRMRTDDDDYLRYFNNNKVEEKIVEKKKEETKEEVELREKAAKESEEKAKAEKAEREEKERLHRVQEESGMRDELYSMKREGKEKIKEKMKRQRLSGQSGIGENFRTWRSDQEMTLRQHYQSLVYSIKQIKYSNTNKSLHSQIIYL